MKQLVRNIFFYCFSKFIPELHYLKKRTTGSLHNVTLHPKTRINPYFNIINSSINEGTYIAPNSHIQNTTIGKYCSIGPNIVCGWGIHPTSGLSTSPIFYSTKKQCGYTFSNVDKIEETKSITIGNDVFIGMNVSILDGVTIGDGAIIGAGTVVSKDIPPYAIAVGAPVQIKKYRFNQDQINELLEIKWWDFEEENKLKDIEKYFFDIDAFILKYINKNQ